MFSFLKKHLPYVQTKKAISTMFVLAHIRTQSKVPFHKKLFFPSLQQFSGRKTTIAKHTLKLCCFFLTQLCRWQNCIKAWKFHFPEVDWEESSSVTHFLNEIPKQALLPAQRRVPPLRSTTGGRPGWQHPGKSCQPSQPRLSYSWNHCKGSLPAILLCFSTDGQQGASPCCVWCWSLNSFWLQASLEAPTPAGCWYPF